MPPILPPEILRIIFAHVDDRNTLCDILLTSRQFCQLVESVLYAQIEFPPLVEISEYTALRSLLEALETSNGRRASYVRALCFAAPPIPSRIEGVIEKILSKTVNLKNWTLYALSRSSFNNGHCFPQSPIFNLTKLHVSDGFLHDIDEDQNLPRFIESQTSLETLHLPVHFCSLERKDKDIFSSTSFPNLKVLFVHPSLVHAFLRTSARLTHLRVCGRMSGRVSGGLARAYWHDLNRTDELCTTNAVRLLSCPDTFEADAVISLASLFPNLEWLSGPIQTMAKLEDLYTHNRKLRGLHFSRHPYEPGLSQSDMPRLFGRISTLQFVDDDERDGGRQSRWYRDAVTSTPIQWLCGPEERWLADWVKHWLKSRESNWYTNTGSR